MCSINSPEEIVIHLYFSRIIKDFSSTDFLGNFGPSVLLSGSFTFRSWLITPELLRLNLPHSKFPRSLASVERLLLHLVLTRRAAAAA